MKQYVNVFSYSRDIYQYQRIGFCYLTGFAKGFNSWGTLL
jgi:hypothetical protein